MKDRELFIKTFGCVRSVYNKMPEDKTEHYNLIKENAQQRSCPIQKSFHTSGRRTVLLWQRTNQSSGSI
ncbi:MAG: helix-turn-helix domain-containing protein [Succinivibrio sp.]|nr:helix-turn-helix domain-containing protein [Succinivibrio sp.]